MGRPPKPAMTEVEHELAHSSAGLRTAAKRISIHRGAHSASATAQERKAREVSWQWVKRSHKALGCDKTLGATKPVARSLTATLRQNASDTDRSATRTGYDSPPGPDASVMRNEP